MLVDSRLRERRLGILQGQPVAVVDPGLYGVEHGRVLDTDRAPTGGKSFRQFEVRVRALLDDLIHSTGDATVVLVTHGGVIRLVRAVHEGLSLPGMPWGEVDNGQCWSALWTHHHVAESASA